MANIYPGGDAQYSTNLGLALWGTDEVVVNNFLLIDAALGAGGGVISFNGRGGVVHPLAGDYAAFYDALGAAAAAQAAAIATSEAFTTSQGYVTASTAPVTSVFGRTGAITAQSGDYASFYDALGAATAAAAASLPRSLMTTAGDMIYENATPTAARLPIGATGQVLTVVAGLPAWVTVSGTGTVTSVSFTGGLISVATPTTTPALTVAGTSGGFPYFSSGTTWASTPALTGIVRGNGATFSAAEISGDATTSGSNALTLATVNSNVGSFTYASITVNAKGLVTAASSNAAPTGTVTSVSFTGGLISVATPTTTPALTVAGTSGGIPYFNSATTWASSAVLPAGDFVLGGGAGAAPTASFSIVPIANGGTATGATLTGIVRGGNPFTASEISGDATTSGTNALTLATVNSNVGSFTYASITVNAKGLITAASSGAGPTGTVTSVSFTGGIVSVATPTTTPALTVVGISGGIPYFTSSSTWTSSAVLPAGDFVLGGGAGVAPSASFSVVPIANGGTATGSTLTGIVRGGNPFTAAEISGDATTSGSNALTLATVNANVGSFTYASITVNAKGLITAAASGAAPTGTVTTFSAGALSPLFTTSVATPTTTPVLTFTLDNAAQNSVFAGPATGGTGAPTFRALVTADLPAGTGTVTSVAFTGGLISVATPTTTPALTVAGTSGGIPYFSSGTAWASSLALASTAVVLGGGAGAAPNTSTQLSFIAPTLTVGLIGTSSGILALAGSTSGHATLTAPAVAGTVANALVSSNAIVAPYLIASWNGTSALGLAAGDMNASRSADTGAVFFGSASATAVGGNNYWYWDGTNMNLGVGSLVVPTVLQANASNFPITIQGLVGSTTTIGALYFVSSPSSSNFAFAGAPVDTYVNAVTQVHFRIGNGTDILSLVSTGLTVNGAINVLGGYQANSTAGVTHAAGAPSSLTTVAGLVTAFSTSDERLKKDITPFTRGLKDLLPVKPITYRWKDDQTTYPWSGFSAQQVAESIPEASPEMPDGMLDFHYQAVLAVAVNAIKELNARIVELERKLEAR